MSRNGQSLPIHRAVPELVSLPRPVYARVESLPRSAATQWHSHPWAQLSYAIRGVLSVHTAGGRYLAPPQRAILVPPGLPHAVISSPATEMRSLYIERSAIVWAQSHCKVLEINPLTRELINHFGSLPADYAEQSADGRLVAVLLDQLQAAAESTLYLPWPADPRLQSLCEALYRAPDLSHKLGDWASELMLSEKTLTRLFQQHTGLSFRAWRQRLRLLSALPLLQAGERVTDVALACGYDSTSAFIAVFRKQLGVTPSAFGDLPERLSLPQAPSQSE